MTATHYPIIDGHNDVLGRLCSDGDTEGRAFLARNEKGHLDLPRAREGGFAGGFFAVFVWNQTKQPTDTEPDPPEIPQDYDLPLPPPLELGYAQRTALGMMATLYRIEAASEGAVKVVRNVDELEQCLADSVLASILHMEGADAIDPGLDALEVFYRAGLRSLGIVWSRPTAFGHGVPFAFPRTPDTGPGLTDAGRELVRACNRLGIMLDLSHINEQGFRDVAALSDAPLVATHSNVHALCASTRNLTDEQLSIIRESGGMVGLNFANCFLRPDGGSGSDVPLEVMVRHLDYLVDHLGIDHVGFGSDFDGAAIPSEIGDVSGLPKLIAVMQAHGYDDESLRKITHNNWIRVLRKTWRDG
jgi:membrane dipeptidase